MSELFDWPAERERARDQINNLLKAGKRQRAEQCMVCGKFCKTVAHHFDYAKPVEVCWLCPACHQAADRLKTRSVFDWERASKVGMK